MGRSNESRRVGRISGSLLGDLHYTNNLDFFMVRSAFPYNDGGRAFCFLLTVLKEEAVQTPALQERRPICTARGYCCRQALMWGCLVGRSLSSSVYAALSLAKTHGVVCSILHFARCRARWELELSRYLAALAKRNSPLAALAAVTTL
jgi:hypothetical protein